MKKRGLRDFPELYATDEMIRVAMQDIGKEIGVNEWSGRVCRVYKYKRYYRAYTKGNILKVAVFTRNSLVLSTLKGRPKAKFEIYCDRENKEYITYEPSSEKWFTGKICNLNFEDANYYDNFEKYAWQTEEDRREVNIFFDTGINKNIHENILDFQSEIKGQQLERKHKSEKDQIDAVMNEVPELPKDFDTWVVKNAFCENMFYQTIKKNVKKCYCSHCGTEQELKNSIKHGEKGICPKCKVEVTYCSWKRQRSCRESSIVQILQRLEDDTGYILRSFSASIRRDREKYGNWSEYELSIREREREEITDGFYQRDFFVWGEYKCTGVFRWCHNSSCRGYNPYYMSYHIGAGFLYTKNLKKVLSGTGIENVDFKRIFTNKGRRKFRNVAEILYQIKQNKFIEYLQKNKLHTLVEELLDRKMKEGYFNRYADKIHTVCNMDKQTFQRMCKYDPDRNVLKAFQLERFHGKISEENIKFIKDSKVNMIAVELLMERTNLTMERQLNYLKRQQAINTGKSIGEIMDLYRDYLNMAEQRGMDITDEIVCKQIKMKEYHDRYLEEKNKEENEARDREVNEKYPLIAENYKETAKYFAFSTKDLQIVTPRMASDITKEGRLQHHCVGANKRYMESMNKGIHFILFLRRKENLNEPYYTLEVTKEGKVVQWYGAYDRKPDKEKIAKVLERFTKKIQSKEKKLHAAEKQAEEQGLVMEAV